MDRIYMAVTADEYELPIAVAGSVQKLATMMGLAKQTVKCGLAPSNDDSGKNKGYKFVRVII